VSHPTSSSASDPVVDDQVEDADVDNTYDEVDDEFGPPSTGSRLPRITAILLAGLLIAGGFVGGAFVQRHYGTSSSASGTFPTLGAGGMPDFSGGGAPGGFGQSGQGGDSGSTGSNAGNSVIGTVVSTTDNTITVKDFGGRTHVVHIDGSTQLQKNVTLSTSDLKKGTTVVVTGQAGSDGSVTANTITQR